MATTARSTTRGWRRVTGWLRKRALGWLAGIADSARRLYQQAAVCYATSYHPLFGAPVDQRLVRAFRTQIETANKGLSLLPVPVKPLRIPYEGTTLPAYLLPATGRENERRPLVILTDGYDSTVTELYFFAAAAIAQRGYHCLYFDGPGQGELLIEQSLPMRPDWEAVIRPVVDFALTLPNVEASKIALMGLSLGGYLALRGASGESRLAACIADPGLGAVMTRDLLTRFGLTAAQVADPTSVPAAFWERAINSSPTDALDRCAARLLGARREQHAGLHSGRDGDDAGGTIRRDRAVRRC